MKSLMSSVPLVVLGLARLVATSATDYHEHVSEYGKHWNFFFTVAIIKVTYLLLIFCGKFKLFKFASGYASI